MSRPFKLLMMAWVGLLALAASFDPVISADPPKPPIKEEEEEPPKPPKPPVKPVEEEEEERPGRPRPKPLPPSEGPFDLAREAERNDLPDDLRDLLRKYAEPFDLVVTKDVVKKTRWKAEPLGKRFDPLASTPIRGFQAVDLDNKDRKVGPVELPRSQIESVEHYEDLVLREVATLSARAARAETGRFQFLRVAEMLLERTLRFHNKDRNREGDGWKEIAGRLEGELRKVRVAQVRALVEEQKPNLDLAEVMAERLYERYKRSHRDLLDAIEMLFLTRAEAEFIAGRYPRVHEHLHSLHRFPGTEELPNVEAFRKRLQEQAARLLEEGQEKARQAQLLLEKDETRGEGRRLQGLAIKAVKEAERAWPRLPGVRETRMAMEKTYPVLRIGVRQLPTQISPTSAESDADRMAVRLIFDRLLQLRSGPSAREGYRSKLGFEPRMKQGGWEFLLPADWKWSDGRAVTADDFRRSLEIMGDPRSASYNPLAGGDHGLLQITTDDRQKVRITLKQSFIDPPALLTFDILPAHLLPADLSPRNPAFARKPTGTGPYLLDRMNDTEAVFVANPYYRRPHVPQGPLLQEINLIRYSDVEEARQMLAADELHMVVDLHTSDLVKFKDLRGFRVTTPTETADKPPHLANPRIYFLAPNHRRPEMQNEDLRQAIACAIHREELLRSVFRGQDKGRFHNALNGPYPLGSWAYHPDYTPDKLKLYNPEAARKHVEEYKKRGSLRPLTLLCPGGDPDAARACERIRNMLQAVEIPVEVVRLPRNRIAAELARESPDFDLLYTHFDFVNETLSLWPLLDPKAIGREGSNFMGYTAEPELEALLRDLLRRRDFATVQTRARELHEMMMKKMIIIPLWQLDRHALVSLQLKLAPGQLRLHPLYWLEDVEEWQLAPKEE